MAEALKSHWPEYLIEATCLGLFMISAFTFGVILEHPNSPLNRTVTDPLTRRFLMGLAMGGTAVALIYSPWGQQSGAHINPATTMTFFRLGKIAPWDAVIYVISQFLGALAGAILAALALSSWTSHPAVNYVITSPGSAGVPAAFIAEAVITFVLMTVILHVSNNTRAHKLTGFCAGVLVALYITFEAPLSGMSMNPARTFASALPGELWQGLWIYFVGPAAGMLLAVEAYRLLRRTPHVVCAKLNHHTHRRCIFHCGYAAAEAAGPPRTR
jgi:aquaporin Z